MNIAHPLGLRLIISSCFFETSTFHHPSQRPEVAVVQFSSEDEPAYNKTTVMQCINKFMLFLINFIAFLVGAVVVIVASITIHKGSLFRDLLSGGIVTLPIIVLLAGLAILLLGFFGCCGASKESACLLKTYAFIVLVLVIAQIVLGILIFVYRSDVEEIVTASMKVAMGRYGLGDLVLDESIDLAQHELECCGVLNANDWSNFTYNGVAEGCCKEMIKDCGEDYFTNPSPPEIWDIGCYDLAKTELEPYNIWLGVLAIVLAVIQLICVSCACSIANNKSRQFV